MDATNRGATPRDIARAFLSALEHTARHPGETSDAAFLADLYHDALGRTANAQGLATWAERLASGASRAEVAIGIAQSAEAQQHWLSAIETGRHPHASPPARRPVPHPIAADEKQPDSL